MLLCIYLLGPDSVAPGVNQLAVCNLSFKLWNETDCCEVNNVHDSARKTQGREQEREKERKEEIWRMQGA